MTLRRPAGGHALPLSPDRNVLPRVVSPMLPVVIAQPFDSSAHVFEVLWSGIRALAFIEGGSVRLQDRFGRDISHRFPELSGVAARTRSGGLVLDGAIVCLDADGRPDFAGLLPRLGVDTNAVAAEMADSQPATFQAFDVLYREGQPVTGWALRRRKELLKSVVRPGLGINVPDWVDKDGVAFFEAARDHQLEGIVAKEAESRYLVGERSRAWVSVRVYPRGEFVICGYTYGGRWNPRSQLRRAREPFASLLLGLYGNDGELEYVGEVTGAFPMDGLHDLVSELDELTTIDCPLRERPELGRLVFWCRPELAATVRYAGWTDDGRLRFPVFEAPRADVPAAHCLFPGGR